MSENLRVYCVPFIAENPYQTQLADGLSRQSVEVVRGRGKSHLKHLIFQTRKERELTHLHWLISWKKSPSGFLAVFKFIGTLLIQRVLGHPIVWTVHNLQHHEAAFPRADRWLGRLVFRMASQVIVHSPKGKQIVTEAFGIENDEKMKVIPHGNYCECYPNEISRIDARKELGLKEDEVIYLFLGGIRGYKGINDLTEAFSRLKNDKARLVIAGKVSKEEELNREHLTDDRVLFHPGYVDDEKIQVYMNACDVVVFPYRDVLTSGAVVLAMSFGKACLAPRLGCICDFLDDQGAHLYDVDAEDGLLEALEQASLKKEDLPKKGQVNLQKAQEWSWERVSRETAEAYREAAK